jgi:hypothetical protein
MFFRHASSHVGWYLIDTESFAGAVARACNGVAEIISLDSNGFGARVIIVVTKPTKLPHEALYPYYL